MTISKLTDDQIAILHDLFVFNTLESVGFIHETGELVVEYKEGLFGENREFKTEKIPRIITYTRKTKAVF